MQQQVHRVSARWPACHTHNCFPSGVWSTQSLAVCQRRTTHKLPYFWWHGPSRHRRSPVSVWLRRRWHSFVNCRRLIYRAIRRARLSSRFPLAAQPQPRCRASPRTPSGHKHSLASLRSRGTRMPSARTALSFEISTSQLIPTYTWKHVFSCSKSWLLFQTRSFHLRYWHTSAVQTVPTKSFEILCITAYEQSSISTFLWFSLSALLVCPINNFIYLFI